MSSLALFLYAVYLFTQLYLFIFLISLIDYGEDVWA